MELQHEQLIEVQALGEYRATLKALRRPGMLGIIFGVGAVVGGVEAMHHDPVNVGLVIIGFAQIMVGLWHVAAPSLNGLAANGVLMIVVGAWNMFVTAYASGTTGVMIDAAGLVQIGYGVYALSKYRDLRGKFPQPPSEETIRFIDELVRHVSRLKPKKSDDVIEFESKPFVGRRRRWTGLLRDAAIFVTRQHDVLCDTRLGVTIAPKRKLLLQKRHTAVLRAGGVTHKGLIPTRSLERFQAWKVGASEAEVEAAFAAGSPRPAAE
jgi:hypothetical protein